MMQFGFCNLAVVPVRIDPSDKAEMTTQLLFGDIVEVLDNADSWCYIKNFYDGYQGWIDVKQVFPLEHEEYQRLSTSPMLVNRQIYSDSIIQNNLVVRLPAGCSFYLMNGQVMKIAGLEYRLEGTAYPFAFSGTEDLLKTAHAYLSSPYLWGGKTYLGMDCSGFTQVVYKQHGISLLRDASQQASQGELVSFLSESLPGDLAFFDNQEGRIIHVGILLNSHEILHCSGKVRTDEIDHQGIFNRDLSRYTHSLRIIRRVVSR